MKYANFPGTVMYRLRQGVNIFIAFILPSVIYCGHICLSCSGVDNVNSCKGASVCRNDEVCFMHKYRTESNTELFDLGCSYPEVCIHDYSEPNGAVFGRRTSDGHHMLCQGCCNDTNVCNMRIPCEIKGDHNASAQKNNLPRECADLSEDQSGVYTIYPDGLKAVKVYCEISNGEKWTVIQRRVNGSVDFYRTWNEYKNGFGSPYGEYWLGNDIIHLISTSREHKLSIYLEDFDNDFKYANYSVFFIGDEHTRYPISVTGFTGSNGCGDSLKYHNDLPFSTVDQHNDHYRCPSKNHGAWWYGYCSYSNLNGPYTGGQGKNETTMEWYHWRSHYSLKKTKMMIKRAHNY